MNNYFPSFFIAGYPKSGTTALYQYLKCHPSIFLPELKEPHFFTADFPGASEVDTMAEYESLYVGAMPSQLKGDASASVIHSVVAMDRILDYSQNARFIVLVREPMAAVRSFHSELLYNFNEDEADFEKAWRLQASRAVGEHVPETCREPGFLQYAHIFSYRDQLPKFFEKVPADQRLVLVFEEFFADPRAGYLSVLDFLGLEDDGRSNFGTVNTAKQFKFRNISTLHHRLVEGNNIFYRMGKGVLSRLGVHPSHLLTRFNLKKKGKSSISPQIEKTIHEYFEPDIKSVELLLGRDIEAWRR